MFKNLPPSRMSVMSSYSRLSGPFPTTVLALPLHITSGVPQALLSSTRADLYIMLQMFLLLRDKMGQVFRWAWNVRDCSMKTSVFHTRIKDGTSHQPLGERDPQSAKRATSCTFKFPVWSHHRPRAGNILSPRYYREDVSA